MNPTLIRIPYWKGKSEFLWHHSQLGEGDVRSLYTFRTIGLGMSVPHCLDHFFEIQLLPSSCCRRFLLPISFFRVPPAIISFYYQFSALLIFYRQSVLCTVHTFDKSFAFIFAMFSRFISDFVGLCADTFNTCSIESMFLTNAAGRVAVGDTGVLWTLFLCSVNEYILRFVRRFVGRTLAMMYLGKTFLVNVGKKSVKQIMRGKGEDWNTRLVVVTQSVILLAPWGGTVCSFGRRDGV